MCGGTLWIDPASMKIIDHKPSEEPKADLDGFLKSYRQDRGWDGKMKKAKEEEARRRLERPGAELRLFKTPELGAGRQVQRLGLPFSPRPLKIK